MPFQQHGSYKLWIKGNVLYALLDGQWNEQAALNFTKDFKALISGFDGDWGHMVYLEQWELCGPEMFEVIQDLVDWCLANGLKRAAHVYKSSAVKQDLISKMVIEEIGDFKKAVFDNPQSAANWLTNEGYQALTDIE